jgi:hypothetical protein
MGFGRQPGRDGPDLLPERRHIDHQVFDDREVGQGLDRDSAVAFEFFADGRPAGQLFRAVDMHGTGAANGGSTGITQRQPAVEFILDPDQSLEHGHAPPDVETIVFPVRLLIGFGIKTLDGKGQAHRIVRRET